MGRKKALIRRKQSNNPFQEGVDFISDELKGRFFIIFFFIIDVFGYGYYFLFLFLVLMCLYVRSFLSGFLRKTASFLLIFARIYFSF